ncbi:glycosyltransferase family 2 protein [Providencia sp. wls1914]|uniref:glycosyltransferase family 2 protein n=1 Tax=Providencia sp. wls1914 TaxID=2675156 RepID=UPI0012B59C0D|nr:glycosyltransferase family A protein [Providencia sp. wls1914]MTC70965.1 glycosyltransferase [Providencia sp. wls1914]
MIFDDKSDMTLVITSCGRFELLKATLLSFDKYNSYPIKKVIITEDSGNTDIHEVIPESWKPYTDIIINKKNLGQIKSIDLAYSKVDTDYIFHCEDDWEFYRSNFIEDSITLLLHDPKLLQVWLRDYDDDIKKHYSFISKDEQKEFENISYSVINSSHSMMRGFSFNPGVKRLSDYKLIKTYNIGKSADLTEGVLSIAYSMYGMYVVILNKSAVKHLGWDNHIPTDSEKFKKSKKIKYTTLGFLFGVLVSMIFSFLIFK